MPLPYVLPDDLTTALRASPRTWLVTGAAGFIGSNLAEVLLGLGQRVIGLDNFATGSPKTVETVRRSAGGEADFTFIEGDVRDADACADACEGTDVVLHQAALGSVPRSIKDPQATHAANVDGFLNVALAARDAGAARFVYASSSSVYGDHPGLPKEEAKIGTPLSPYAVSKRVDELYAQTVQDHYGLEGVGLRYFNVFGPRQDPDGPYAAVIPKWIGQLLAGEPCVIYGDGETSRDFCFVANAVQANLRAALAPAEATDAVYNIAVGERTTLNELYAALRNALAEKGLVPGDLAPQYDDFRPGDVRHSLADISKARRALGYEPTHRVPEALRRTVDWYVATYGRGAVAPAEP